MHRTVTICCPSCHLQDAIKDYVAAEVVHYEYDAEGAVGRFAGRLLPVAPLSHFKLQAVI
jgi:hypothetical protein